MHEQGLTFDMLQRMGGLHGAADSLSQNLTLFGQFDQISDDQACSITECALILLLSR